MRINGCHISVCIVAALCLACQTVFGYTLDWTANSLNQYTEFTHDADGNMTQCGDWTYTYDAANRLKTVSSNGVLLVTNFYDAKSRRVKKVTTEATTTFFYDGWNLIEELVVYASGTTSTIRYYWGKDLSGTLQGAGGVGGLLYLTINGVPFIPCYDNIGNITRYLDANGNVVAQYTYDAFGGTISSAGSLASFFRHRFSTKYYDTETEFYYYGYRFYSSMLRRWLTRDPIGERGGLNLYAFCKNAQMFEIDAIGYSVFNYLPFTSTILSAIESYVGHVPGSSAADYSFVSPRDCQCNIVEAEEQCKNNVKKESLQYIADILSSAAIARAIDIGIIILTLRADPRVSAVFAVDGTIGFIINAKAHAKIMEGANKAKSENCSCSQYGY